MYRRRCRTRMGALVGGMQKDFSDTSQPKDASHSQIRFERKAVAPAICRRHLSRAAYLNSGTRAWHHRLGSSILFRGMNVILVAIGISSAAGAADSPGRLRRFTPPRRDIDKMALWNDPDERVLKTKGNVTESNETESISFSGDLEIFIGTPVPSEWRPPTHSPSHSPAPSPTPSLFSVPSTSLQPPPASSISCSESYSQELRLTFHYSIETMDGYDPIVVTSDLEEELNKRIASDLLLPCPDRRLSSKQHAEWKKNGLRSGNNRLSRQKRDLSGSEDGGRDYNEIGVVAFDSRPDDRPSQLNLCTPTRNENDSCTVIDGTMSVFLHEEGDFETVLRLSLSSILAHMRGGSFVGVVPGLTKVVYRGPEILENDSGDTPSSEDDPATTTSAINRDDSKVSRLGVGQLVGIAVGSAACVGGAAMAMFYSQKPRRSSGKRQDRDSGRGGDFDVDNDGLDDDTQPGTPPVSPTNEDELVRGITKNGALSIILEDDDEQSSETPSIMMSEGWTTDEESVDLRASASCSNLLVLGARRRESDVYPLPAALHL